MSRRSIDQELMALKTMVRLFLGLEYEGKRRILDYLNGRWPPIEVQRNKKTKCLGGEQPRRRSTGEI